MYIKEMTQDINHVHLHVYCITYTYMDFSLPHLFNTVMSLLHRIHELTMTCRSVESGGQIRRVLDEETHAHEEE